MMSNELLPCPFCGGEAFTYSMETWWVSHACDCLGKYVGTKEYATETEAVAAWNTRADDYRQAAEYWQRMYERNARAERICKPVEKDGVMRCPDCDYPLGIMSVPAYCAGCGAKVVSE